MSCTLSTNDYLPWQATEIVHGVLNNELPEPFYILGDNAFLVSRSIIVPCDDDAFNFEQISFRSNIECAFGELIRRWCILWRPLEMAFELRTAVFGCCIRLHNFCIDARLEVSEDLKRKNVIIEMVPLLKMLSPRMNENGSPVDLLTSEYRCATCRQSGSHKRKAYDSRRSELEKYVWEMTCATLSQP